MTTHALAIRSVSEVQSLAEQLAKSGLTPDTLRGKPQDVFVVLLTGLELGLSAMQALRGIYIVKGRPILAADTLVALCVRSPVCKYFRCVESTPLKATYETLREGHPEPVKLIWTLDMAKRAGLGGQTWSAHPEAMLRHRCAAALARDVYPDLVLGMYEASEGEEMAARVEASERRPTPTVEGPKALPAPDAGAIRERIALASSLEALEALGSEVRSLPQADRETLRTDYAKRKAELTKPVEAPKEVQS